MLFEARDKRSIWRRQRVLVGFWASKLHLSKHPSEEHQSSSSLTSKINVCVHHVGGVWVTNLQSLTVQKALIYIPAQWSDFVHLAFYLPLFWSIILTILGQFLHSGNRFLSPVCLKMHHFKSRNTTIFHPHDVLLTPQLLVGRRHKSLPKLIKLLSHFWWCLEWIFVVNQNL